MARKQIKYQYETSPRKIEPNYAPTKRKTPKKAKAKATKKTNNKNILEKKTIKYLLIGFTIIFAIAYRNSQIDESFKKMQKLKDELAVVQKENVQLEIAIENASNLNNLEQQAKELLGMQKLKNKQTIYVNLPKEDYIETATEEVKIEEKQSIFERIKKLFK